MDIQQVRQQYPQYDDLSDEELARSLHQKSYSDMPFEEFSRRIGLGADPDVPTPVNLAQERPQQESDPMESAIGALEAGATMATGGLFGGPAYALGVLDRLGREIIEGEYGTQEAADRIIRAGQQLASTVTYQPRTETGQDIVETVGEVGEQFTGLAPLTPAISGAAQGFIQGTRAVSGLPATPRRAQQLPVVKDEGMPEQTYSISEFFEFPQSKVKQELVERIESGDRSEDLAAIMLEPRTFGRGQKPVRDPIVSDLVAVSFDPGVLQPMKTQNAATMRELRRMASIQENITRDRLGNFNNRPGDVAGDVFTQRLNGVIDANRRAGQEIDRVVRQDLAGQRVDLAPIGDGFVEQLSRLGITGIGDELDFSNSSLALAPQLQTPLKAVHDRMVETGGVIDAQGLHNLKRQIDNMISYSSRQEGLSGDAERTLMNLRTLINQQLREQFPEYEIANRQYSETIGIINEVQRIAGRQIDLQGENAPQALGQLMRRLMSNAQSRVPLMEVVEQVDNFIPTLGNERALPGPTGERVNLHALILFADELDSAFGAAARTSLQGQFDQSLSRLIGEIEGRGAGAFDDLFSPSRLAGRIAGRFVGEDEVATRNRQFNARIQAAQNLQRLFDRELARQNQNQERQDNGN